MNRYRIQSVNLDAYNQGATCLNIALVAIGPFDLDEPFSEMNEGRLLTLMPAIIQQQVES